MIINIHKIDKLNLVIYKLFLYKYNIYKFTNFTYY